MIAITQKQRDDIRRHGEAEYPHECCGLLIGRFTEDGRKMVAEVYPVSNARAEEDRHNRSLILPREYMRGERYARERGLEIVGNYHSHPDDRAVPSQFDLDHAWPTWSYIIVSVREGVASDLRSWEMETDRSRFNEEELAESDES
jgi:proteasome lid subunit RPN8/RPN11